MKKSKTPTKTEHKKAAPGAAHPHHIYHGAHRSDIDFYVFFCAIGLGVLLVILAQYVNK
jgi:hypothetical protein